LFDVASNHRDIAHHGTVSVAHRQRGFTAVNPSRENPNLFALGEPSLHALDYRHDRLAEALSRERARQTDGRIEAARSGGRRRAFPLLGSFSSEAAERSAGDQVALNVEGVVDCRMSGEEALR
jgi:hypothetical protein